MRSKTKHGVLMVSPRPVSHGHFILIHFCEFDSAMQSRSYGLAKDLMFAWNESKTEKCGQKTKHGVHKVDLGL